MDSGYLGSSVAIVMNNSLAKHMFKISKIFGRLLFIKLLFKNKLSVLILGLYAGAFFSVHFFQAGEINFLIAKAVNESSFIIFGSNFNEDGSHRCVSYKKCLDLGLVNSLGKSLVAKTPMWCNSHNITRVINYMFVSSNLVNSIVNCSITDVVDHFNIDHKAIAVFMGLGDLLDV
ncbi:hypothetical protein G9A89_022304 [Geosiphon pyriformis]|nr:hypothetical protein G9A89_022304 [Geosiphon pyriformis]